MPHGFDFFKTRQGSILETITYLEGINGVSLPPIYRLFINTFVTGDQGHINWLKDTNYILCKPMYQYPHLLTQSEAGYFLLGAFYTIEEAFNYWNSEVKWTKAWSEYGLFDIGYGWSGSIRIYVGVRPDNLDEVWISDWDCAVVEKPTKILSNVFELVKGFYEEDMSFYKENGKLDRFYQKWGEDIWRLSPEPLKEEKL
jgi:hypothetical protein